MDRFLWERDRIIKEGSGKKVSPQKGERKRKWDWFKIFLKVGHIVCDLLGIGYFGRKNALAIEVKEVKHSFEDYPAKEDLKILHLSDFHLNDFPQVAHACMEKIKNVECDIAVLTGDFFTIEFPTFDFEKLDFAPLEELVKGIKAKKGIYAVLGNHDSASIVPKLESLGINVLINQQSDISHGGAKFRLIGTDDVHYFFTPEASKALFNGRNHWSIALVHSPEAYALAAEAEIKLYLCGHTHGGQISLPGGIPIITHSDGPRKLSRGLWREGNMIGYTSNGIGTNTLPYRFFARPEVIVHVLSKK